MLTLTGQLVGTLAYVSPEQVSRDSAQLDIRTDVYSLGVVLFDLLAGQLPLGVDGQPLGAALQVVQNAQPMRLGAIDAALHGDLEIIVARCLEKDPDQRYGSASELAADLRRYLS